MIPTKKPLLGVWPYNQKRVTRQGESGHFSSRDGHGEGENKFAHAQAFAEMALDLELRLR